MMNDPTTTWVEAAQRGDEHAAARLIQHTHARVFAFLRRLTGSESDAVELTQRTFCRAWTSLNGFAGRASVASWLHGIAYRVYVDWLRARRRNEERPEAWWEALADPAPHPDSVAADRDAAATVFALVDGLEEGLRETLHLHYYQGLTIEETADALGVAPSTVKYRVREALGKVQGLLARVGQPHVTRATQAAPTTPSPRRS